MTQISYRSKGSTPNQMFQSLQCFMWERDLLYAQKCCITQYNKGKNPKKHNITSLILQSSIRRLNHLVFTTAFLACTHSNTGNRPQPHTNVNKPWIQQEAEPCVGSHTVKHNSTYYSSIIDFSFLIHAQYQASSV